MNRRAFIKAAVAVPLMVVLPSLPGPLPPLGRCLLISTPRGPNWFHTYRVSKGGKLTQALLEQFARDGLKYAKLYPPRRRLL